MTLPVLSRVLTGQRCSLAAPDMPMGQYYVPSLPMHERHIPNKGHVRRTLGRPEADAGAPDGGAWALGAQNWGGAAFPCGACGT